MQMCDKGALWKTPASQPAKAWGQGASVHWDFLFALSVNVHSDPVAAGSLSTLGKLRHAVNTWPAQ